MIRSWAEPPDRQIAAGGAHPPAAISYCLVIKFLCVPDEGAVALVLLPQIDLGDGLPGRVHGQHRHAAVDHVHAVLGADIGDGTAAAHVHRAQLSGLPGDLRLVADAAHLGDKLGVAVVGAGLVHYNNCIFCRFI